MSRSEGQESEYVLEIYGNNNGLWMGYEFWSLRPLPSQLGEVLASLPADTLVRLTLRTYTPFSQCPVSAGDPNAYRLLVRAAYDRY